MSKDKPSKKKVVVTTQKKKESGASGQKATATGRRRGKTPAKKQVELIFGAKNYLWMGIGIGLIFIGFLLMAGGQMPSPDVWEPQRIYSFRRTVLAPIFILAGLGTEIYAIFKR